MSAFSAGLGALEEGDLCPPGRLLALRANWGALSPFLETNMTLIELVRGLTKTLDEIYDSTDGNLPSAVLYHFAKAMLGEIDLVDKR